MNCINYTNVTKELRGQGIIFMPDWIINNKTINFNNLIKKMFINRYELPRYI